MQSSYTANLTITANTAWGTWYAYSDRACDDTAKVYRWYVAAFFSAQAQARYQWIGQMIGCIVALAILYVQRWAESEVQSCTAQPADHIADAGEMVEVDPFCPDANPAYATIAAPTVAPVATLVVKAEPAKPVTSAELRRQCQSAGIKWRNAHGNGRHLSKAEMIALLECWHFLKGA